MRTTRHRLGMSQMGLHVRTGLDRTFISDLERGVQCPSLRTIFRVAKGLGTTPSILLRETAKSPYFVFPTEEDGR
jgi:transcriptional regulator with XRE-family HTH domain